jgi:hypothetical protein
MTRSSAQETDESKRCVPVPCQSLALARSMRPARQTLRTRRSFSSRAGAWLIQWRGGRHVRRRCGDPWARARSGSTTSRVGSPWLTEPPSSRPRVSKGRSGRIQSTPASTADAPRNPRPSKNRALTCITGEMDVRVDITVHSASPSAPEPARRPRRSLLAWCNEWAGVVALLALIVMILTLVFMVWQSLQVARPQLACPPGTQVCIVNASLNPVRDRLVIAPRQQSRATQAAGQVIRLQDLVHFLRFLHTRPPRLGSQVRARRRGQSTD